MKGFVICALFAITTGMAGAQDQSSPGKLPVKRVVLFKNGVGYFEHVGGVRGNESVAVSFTSGQLNDVLKSLTVLDLNGGRITGIAYGTAAPVSRQMGTACGSLGSKSTQADLLNAVRGSRVELHNGGATYSGRLIGVEQKTRTAANMQQTVDYLSVLTESGELRTVELSPSATVRLLEPGLSGRLDRCLTLAATETNADVRNMVISTEGDGTRNLSVSYISEVPVWKSTYRLVLGSDKPLLQGWAIVDNVVGEDWNNVELSLVAGAPQSFIQNLSQPYYAQRPTVALPDTGSLAPQTYQSTLSGGEPQLAGTVRDAAGSIIPGAQVTVQSIDGTPVGSTTTDSNGRYEIPELPDSGNLKLRVTAPGFMPAVLDSVSARPGSQSSQDMILQVGSSTQTVEVQAEAPPVANLGRNARLGSFRPSAGLVGGSLNSVVAGSGGGSGGGSYIVKSPASGLSVASAQALGDLFEYKVKDPITILKNRSALAPIVQTAIEAEKVSVWNQDSQLPKPQRAVWIKNTSGLTLDGGALSVLEDDTFAGEGIFDPIRPGERRIISYATDLAVTAASHDNTEYGRVTRVVIGKGIMTQQSQLRQIRTYTFRNEDVKPRSIVVEHPVRNGFKLIGDIHPVETTPDWMRFKVSVEPKQTQKLLVAEAQPSTFQVALSNVTNQQLTVFLSQHSIDPTIESAIRDILSRKDRVASLESKANNLDSERQGIFDDQQRLRENVKALKGAPEEKPLLERYTRQLNDQESRLDTLQHEKADLESRIAAANEDLTATIEKLAFDVTL